MHTRKIAAALIQRQSRFGGIVEQSYVFLDFFACDNELIERIKDTSWDSIIFLFNYFLQKLVAQ